MCSRQNLIAAIANKNIATLSAMKVKNRRFQKLFGAFEVVVIVGIRGMYGVNSR